MSNDADQRFKQLKEVEQDYWFDAWVILWDMIPYRWLWASMMGQSEGAWNFGGAVDQWKVKP